jgi:excisionase family DNA binding protein
MKTQTESKQNVSTNVFSPDTVAEIMEVKKSFVLRMLREGHLKGFKMGKFWRIMEEQLEEFMLIMSESANGKTRMKAEAREKIRFHTCLRSQDSLPKTVEDLENSILDLKAKLNRLTGHKKVAAIAKLKAAVQQREELKEKIGSMDETLNAIGSKAYPDFIELVDMNPDDLESLFVQNANNPDQGDHEAPRNNVRKMKAKEAKKEKQEMDLANVEAADH